MNAKATLGEIEGLWRDLESRANPSFFLSWSWIGTLLGSVDCIPSLVIVRSHDRVVGLGLVTPGKQTRFGLAWPSLVLNETGVAKYDCIMIEDNNFLAEVGWQESVTTACLDFLSDAMTSWRELRVSGVPDSVLRIARSLEMPIVSDHVRASPFVELSKATDNLNWLSNNTRQQVRRSLRLYRERDEIVLAPSGDLTDLRARFVEMETLHRTRWLAKGMPGAFAEPFFKKFHSRLLERAFPLGQADILRVALGQRTIGLLYMFFGRDEASVYQNGFCYESDPRLKPGLVSHVLAIGYCKNRDLKRYRLLAGDSRYKRSLATHSDSLHWLSIRRPHLAFRLESAARRITGRRLKPNGD